MKSSRSAETSTRASIFEGSGSRAHAFPFVPEVTDFPPTDQIFVGSVQTGFHDGYSVSPRTNGPQTAVLDFSSLVPAGHEVTTLTLGIAADDFQFPVFGQPFTATASGIAAVALTAQLNSLSQTGPVVQFFGIGLDPAIYLGGTVLTVSIDQGGDGGDGWAVDFFTVGVTTAPVQAPQPGTLALLSVGLAGLATMAWCRRLRAGHIRVLDSRPHDSSADGRRRGDRRRSGRM